MQEMLELNVDFQKNLSTLEDYISFNKDNKEANYREYRDIVYGAIINRGYTLWETYVKDLFFSFFTLKKQEYYDNNTLIEKYKLYELPGFLFEAAQFDLANESITFKLNKDIVSFTSKNMDMKEMSKLFKRIEIDIQNKIDNNDELKNAITSFELAFENGLLEQKKPTQAIKRIIQERNLVSHYAHIDNFQSIDILLEWIRYYKLLGKVLCKTICLEYIKTVDSVKKIIGECKNALGNEILLVDINSEINFDKSTLLYVYSDNKIIDVVIPVSFMVNDNEVSVINSNDKAGIRLKTIFEYNTRIKKEYKYYLIDAI
ncbi:HEPN domain-containing protein [Bacillus sp. FJAT-28004]|uniref:HEPN domain-containing protein n=1 Tax=Bacillus sp. FJAT-28004 TaxID=1679165 RepID=UPI0006B42BF3|nr:HEPN domain-containing protein [Bacillus sp. FJAT-28004]